VEFDWDFISSEDYERIRDLHEPLAQSIRRLIDASIHTGADAGTIQRARVAIDEVSTALEETPTERPRTLRHAETGMLVAWVNPAVGRHNPVAPVITTQHYEGRLSSEFTLGPVYEGPPGLVHGGVCALLLDQLLGEVATNQLTLPKFTGTITLKYLRGTPLGALRAEAWVDRVEGQKTYARGFLADGQGPTVEAEGLFIMPAWARDETA
jgi:acyl-coenzyme A thioesterase PaaI-like protein